MEVVFDTPQREILSVLTDAASMHPYQLDFDRGGASPEAYSGLHSTLQDALIFV
ncbi:hypothetical protein BDV37DRAFT_266237 [Aspergillus pseudonomiae]|uniref:Uncharacterized protein n=1 Tax=Aspergillus pseudonomiae TaxID=1506151 RepID=A0A5N7CSJ1_9EURO|nr:uncharacterized protein BDV37DRAFT_266237 [Aspergillus pseudonomiae]KAE8397210.1 hypothetical protein BDV37DRAFT_266237 [Aspergillus pseudonomiae]